MAKNDQGFIIPDGVASDVLFFTFKKGELNILLIERLNEPKGFALPGGFLDPTENMAQCATREAKEEVGLDLKEEELTLVGVYSDPNRDPRARIISAAYGIKVPASELEKAQAGDDASSLRFVSVQEVIDEKIEMVFDHKKIIEDGVKVMKLEKFITFNQENTNESSLEK